MIPLTALWMPIVLSAVLVFVASSIIHMVLRYHRTDIKPTADEEALRQALKKQNLTPGQYVIPWCPPEQMKAPEMIKKRQEGPVAVLTVLPSGRVGMGPQLAQWFIYCLVISIFVAYLTGRVLAPGHPYLVVFRVAGTAAFLGYSGAAAVQSIWMGLPWSTAIKNILDGLIYALFTAGSFGWLWPR
jgi:hypothetical protein